ncbi:MAG: cytochrome c [Candidatus Kapabacteria bacterium]|nr:cytochrome c [Candidatus Kapabacteria bacterium]
MLSKKQARMLFIVSTGLFTIVFLALTYDSMQQIPAQTSAHNLSPSAIRGHEIWNDNNCMGCHTVLGEGAYYAPELTKVYERRGEKWMKMFLKDPEAMYPGQRKMVQYNFTDAQIDDLISFFKWIGEMDLNGFPAKPTIKMSSAQNNSAVSANSPQVFKDVCVACHSVNGSGGNVGPALDHVGSKFDAAYLNKWISDPQAVKPGTTMPQLNVSDTDRALVVEFLSGLK